MNLELMKRAGMLGLETSGVFLLLQCCGKALVTSCKAYQEGPNPARFFYSSCSQELYTGHAEDAECFLKVSVPPWKIELNGKWQFMLPGVSVRIANEDSGDKQWTKIIQKAVRMFCL